MAQSLSISTVRAAAGARVVARGEELLDSPLLFARTRCGEGTNLELFARCHGSQGEVYTLRAAVEGERIAESRCTCPFDGNGLCKHRVALLLAQIREPASFDARPSLATMIADYSPEALRELVTAMVRREPGLLPLVDAARGAADGDANAVRDGLRRALSGRDAADGALVLERGFARAAHHENEADWFAAGTFYSLVVDELAQAAPRWETAYEKAVEFGEGYHDEDWDFGDSWAHQAVAGLERCFDSGPLAPEAKRQWTQTLWQAEERVKNSDYFALPAAARHLIALHAPDDLWAAIETSIRTALEQRGRGAAWNTMRSGSGVVWQRIAPGDDWERQSAIEFLLSRRQARGVKAGTSDESQLIEELGTTQQRFALKIQQNDLERAAKIADEFYLDSPSQLLECATRLDGVGASALARQLVEKAASRAKGDLALVTWLADFTTRSNEAPAARRYAAQLFAARPDEAHFQILRRAVALAGEWEEQYEGLETEIKALAGKDFWGNRAPAVALRLAIFDGNAARVLERFALIPKKNRSQWLESVAASCEGQLPAKALELWRELAEWTIENRNPDSARNSYKNAAQALRRARIQHQKLGTMDEWKDYIVTLRGVYKTLRALQDELTKAGL